MIAQQQALPVLDVGSTCTAVRRPNGLDHRHATRCCCCATIIVVGTSADNCSARWQLVLAID